MSPVFKIASRAQLIRSGAKAGEVTRRVSLPQRTPATMHLFGQDVHEHALRAAQATLRRMRLQRLQGDTA